MHRLIFFIVCASVLLVTDATMADPPKTEPPNKTAWKSLFDGKTLGQWEPLKKIDFKHAGAVKVDDGTLVLTTGDPATGIRYKGKFPKDNFELTMEAKRTAGNDFFCGLTFPVKDGSLTLIMGGWGGWVVGLSCIDGAYAIDNDTVSAIQFKQDQWYRVRVRVAEDNVQVWVDDDNVIELETAGHKLAVSSEMEPCRPLGIATWKSTGVLRKIRFRPVDAKKDRD